MQKFGGWLRAARKATGASQDDLADASGISQGTISNLERGASRPEWATLDALCKALGQDPTEPARLIAADLASADLARSTAQTAAGSKVAV